MVPLLPPLLTRREQNVGSLSRRRPEIRCRRWLTMHKTAESSGSLGSACEGSHDLAAPAAPLPSRRAADENSMNPAEATSARPAHGARRKEKDGAMDGSCLRMPKRDLCSPRIPATRLSNKERLEIRLMVSVTRLRSNTMRVPHPKSSHREHLIDWYEVGLNYSLRTVTSAR